MITILQHPKERRSKCTLEPLRGRPDVRFIKAREGLQFDATGLILLAPDAPELSPADAGCPILVLDSTWRLLPQLGRCITGEPLRRSLPTGLRTAYPRVSKIGPEPYNGLASIEALYAALRLLGHDDPSLLDGYHWKAQFLANLAAR